MLHSQNGFPGWFTSAVEHIEQLRLYYYWSQWIILLVYEATEEDDCLCQPTLMQHLKILPLY